MWWSNWDAILDVGRCGLNHHEHQHVIQGLKRRRRRREERELELFEL